MGSVPDETIAVDTIFVNRLDSSEFSSKLVPINVEGLDKGLNSDLDKSAFLGSVSTNNVETQGGFTKWLSQGLLLKQIEAADRRARFVPKQPQDSLDFMVPEEVTTDAAVAKQTNSTDVTLAEKTDSTDAIYASEKESISAVFFMSDGSNNPVLSHIFDHSKNMPASTELLSQIESFKEDFFELVNRHYDALILKKALLTVLFNHYGGHMVEGCMTLKEYLHMITCHDIFSNVTMAKFVFDAMDRKRSSMIVLNDFIAGMLACSPDASDDLALAYGKLRLQHIFRAYDLERRGFLDKETLSVMLSHLEHLSSGGKVTANLSNGQRVGTRKSVDTFLGNIHEVGVNYDVFYSKVASGAIKNTKLLLRSNQDLAKSLAGFFQQVLDKPVCTPIKRPETRLKPVEPVVRPSSPESNLVISKLSLWNSLGTPAESQPIGERNLLDQEDDDESAKTPLFTTRTTESSQHISPSSNLYNFPGLNMKKAWSRTSPVHVSTRPFGVNSFSGDLDSIFSESEDDAHTNDDVLYEKVDVLHEVDVLDTKEQGDTSVYNDGLLYNEPDDGLLDTTREPEDACVYDVQDVNAEPSGGTQTPDGSTKELDPEPAAPCDTMEEDSSLDEKLDSLVKNYRHKYLGFRANEVDHTVALRVFKKFYRKMLELGDSFNVGAHFDWCTYSDLLKLCDSTCNLLKKEDSLLMLDGPVQVYGSINGDVTSLNKVFNTYGWPCNITTSNSSLGEPVVSLFVGSFTSDVGTSSLEFVTFLFSLKILFPLHIYLLRSGKDNRLYNNRMGFYNEIYNTFSRNVTLLNFPNEEALVLQNARELFHRINDVFEFISVAAVISDKVLCLYGTISPELKSIRELLVQKPVAVSSRELSGKVHYYHDNVHVNQALFGSAQGDVTTEDELVTGLGKIGIKMLVSCDDDLRSGYEYSHNSAVLRISTKFRDDTVATLVSIRPDEGEILINHRSIRINSLPE